VFLRFHTYVSSLGISCPQCIHMYNGVYKLNRCLNKSQSAHVFVSFFIGDLLSTPAPPHSHLSATNTVSLHITLYSDGDGSAHSRAGRRRHRRLYTGPGGGAPCKPRSSRRLPPPRAVFFLEGGPGWLVSLCGSGICNFRLPRRQLHTPVTAMSCALSRLTSSPPFETWFA
jgi:hypothetical protein